MLDPSEVYCVNRDRIISKYTYSQCRRCESGTYDGNRYLCQTEHLVTCRDWTETEFDVEMNLIYNKYQRGAKLQRILHE